MTTRTDPNRPDPRFAEWRRRAATESGLPLDSDRTTILAWCQAMDPNGTYTDATLAPADTPWALDEAWAGVALLVDVEETWAHLWHRALGWY